MQSDVGQIQRLRYKLQKRLRNVMSAKWIFLDDLLFQYYDFLAKHRDIRNILTSLRNLHPEAGERAATISSSVRPRNLDHIWARSEALQAATGALPERCSLRTAA